ncbi:MAG: MATE family efflux transporter [Eubacteriales bacterium]|nr:MATE family efflux transporter [Eubacteriales bacterium]
MAFFGDTGINAFAIISYLSSFTMAVFFGASEGMQPLFGQAYGAREDDDLRAFYRAGLWISVIGSALCVAVYVLFPRPLCRMFGADAATLAFTAAHMWEYCWGFVVGSVNSMLSAYFYSTKRSGQAIVLNIIRSLVMNSLIITLLPKLFGSAVVWHTFGIYETLVLLVGAVMKKHSERRGILYR